VIGRQCFLADGDGPLVEGLRLLVAALVVMEYRQAVEAGGRVWMV
jgi:hypothetical protein